MPEPEPRSRIVLRVSAETSDQLHATAWEAGVSIAHVCRAAIARYLQTVPNVGKATLDWISVGRPRDRRGERHGSTKEVS
jgi:hypothetical protein